MLIDEFLTDYQIGKQHHIIVNAPIRVVYEAAKSLDMDKSSVITLLFRFRGLPKYSLTLEGLQKIGFTILGENPNKEFLLGLAGQFWTLNGQLQQLDPKDFKSFNKKGFAKAVWNFSMVQLSENETEIRTETRIQCLDSKSYSKFRLYWLLIGPFSAWIRKETLQIIKRESEKVAKITAA